MAEVVSVLNMKGGVGKTTISAHVMRMFQRYLAIKVLLVDLDPQFNLTQCLITRAKYDALKLANQTIFAAMEPPSKVGLFDVAVTHHAPPIAKQVSIRLRHFKGQTSVLDLVPGNFELVKYSLINDQNKLNSVQTRFKQFISTARNDYDLVVIDCNPSSSFITLCALEACSQLLVPVRPDRYSILGLEMVTDFVSQIPTIHPKPKISVLLNGVPRSNYDSSIEDELRAHKDFGTAVLTNKLRVSSLLSASPGYTGFATDKPVSNRHTLAYEIIKIVNELAPRWGLKK